MRKSHLVFLLLVVLTFITADPAQALSLAPGYDLYSTQGGFIAVDIDGPGGLDPIPVPVKGRPIHGSLFDTDMIIQRKDGADPFNPGDTETIPIEIVALSLSSVAPILVGSNFYNVDFSSGRFLADPASPYYNQAALPNNPDGTSEIKKLNSEGGTFSSFFDVFFEIKLTDINDPTNFDTLYQQYLWSLDEAPWVETPGHSYPNIPSLPSGNFYPQDAKVNTVGGQLLLTPATTPEPLSLVLMGGGLAGLFAFRKKSVGRAN